MIYFYDKDKPHYSFTNFAEYSVCYRDGQWHKANVQLQVRYEGRLYPTSEHLFQAMKVCHLSIGLTIGMIPSSNNASHIVFGHTT